MLIRWRKENLIKKLPDYDACTLRVSKLNENILKHCPKLKVISRHGVGYDNVDLNYIINKEKTNSNNLEELCKMSSKKERSAIKAERDYMKFILLWLIKDKAGIVTKAGEMSRQLF